MQGMHSRGTVYRNEDSKVVQAPSLQFYEESFYTSPQRCRHRTASRMSPCYTDISHRHLPVPGSCSMSSVRMAVLRLLCAMMLRIAIRMLIAVLASAGLCTIVRRLPGIDPGQQGLQQGPEGAQALQLPLVQLGCTPTEQIC